MFRSDIEKSGSRLLLDQGELDWRPALEVKVAIRIFRRTDRCHFTHQSTISNGAGLQIHDCHACMGGGSSWKGSRVSPWRVRGPSKALRAPWVRLATKESTADLDGTILGQGAWSTFLLSTLNLYFEPASTRVQEPSR